MNPLSIQGVPPAAVHVAVRIGAGPAVKILGHVERLATVADEVAHDPHQINHVGAGVFRLGGRPVFLIGLQIGESRLKLAVVFRNRPGQEAGKGRGVIVIILGVHRPKTGRVGRARRGKLDRELVAILRECGEVHPRVGYFLQVECVVRRRGVPHHFIPGVAPAVGLGGKKDDAIRIGRRADPGGKVSGQRGQGHLVHDLVALDAPRVEGGRRHGGQQSRKNDGEKGRFHCGFAGAGRSPSRIPP